MVGDSGSLNLIPAQAKEVHQKWDIEVNPTVTTEVSQSSYRILNQVRVEKNEGAPYCVMTVEASSASAAWLVISLRPFNPEGVSEVGHIELLDQGLTWKINKKEQIHFSEVADEYFFSNFSEGDVYRKIVAAKQHSKSLGAVTQSVSCISGMATAAVAFEIPREGKRLIEIQIPLVLKILKKPAPRHFIEQVSNEAQKDWAQALEGHCRLHVNDEHTELLYDQAIRSLVLHTPNVDVFPGPYTYKHFWFRDAAFILHALLAAGLVTRAEKILDFFPSRQKFDGYFCSQDGEWDSNGQVLWIFRRFCELTGTLPKPEWKESIRKGAEWIEEKRLSESLVAPEAGLFPSGFSAEHLGPNDFYYWDDFWGVEGYLSASYLMKQYNEFDEAKHYAGEATGFEACIHRSLERNEKRLGTKAMPASPYRRLDTGVIGSLTVGYPMNIWNPDDARVMQTVEYLLKSHFVEGGFFHEMGHSGINPYLTLTVAQILLRNNDSRYMQMMRRVQKLASPTGQWPEAIHPHTYGGCMGDGQHVWAATEWILMIRNCFVREEKDYLILCSGVLPEWIAGGKEVSFGSAPTPYGSLTLYLSNEGEQVRVSWDAHWRGAVPQIEIRLPGHQVAKVTSGETTVLLSKEKHLKQQ